MKCQSCGSKHLKDVLSLGYLPPPNDYHYIGEEAKAETWMPTDLLYCQRCDLVQLAYTAHHSAVFPAAYPYTSGTTKLLRDNFADLAREAVPLVDIGSDDLVVDIGSNDGTLLSNFIPHAHVVGVEPTDIADIAGANGITTYKMYFNKTLAAEIRDVYGKAKLVTCTNCFAHIDGVHGIIDGIDALLGHDGMFVSESHYLIDLIERVQYDTIYHEHLRYYSLNSLQSLLNQHGFEVFHIKRIPTHGGSIRVYAARKGVRAQMMTSTEAIKSEPHGTELDAMLGRFGEQVMLSKLKLMSRLHWLKRERKRIVGISAPSRAATVINYCRLDDSIIDYVVEIEGSLKIGKCMPGTNIPVVSEVNLFEDQPDAAILFSWHLADELIPKLREKGYRGEFIMPIVDGT